MANTLTLGAVRRGREQFHGLFCDMWAVTVDASFDTDITGNDELSFDVPVNGIQQSDMVLGVTPYGNNSQEHIFSYKGIVSETGVLEITIFNHKSSADTPLPTNFKVLIARPAW
jgi:hypothetical protein